MVHRRHVQRIGTRAPRRLVAPGLIVLALVLIGCATPVATGVTLPSDEEARSFLATAVGLARSGSWEELCALGGGNCEETLNDAGRDAVPADGPIVLATWLVTSTPAGDGRVNQGGRILEVCGIDGRDRPYRTQMLVFREAEKLIAIEPIYWSGMTVASGSVVGPKPTPAAVCPGE